MRLQWSTLALLVAEGDREVLQAIREAYGRPGEPYALGGRVVIRTKEAT
jgi:hypothetical protein